MAKRKALAIMALTWAIAIGLVSAEGPKAPLVTSEEFEAKLGYQTGTVALKNGMATIRMPPSFRFIGPEGSRRLLVEAWGNPPGAAEGVLGMLIPAAVSPLTAEGWGIVITYDEDGYVDDKGAAAIDYDKLLKEMQESIVAANPERKKAGFQPMTLVGWAEPPAYDPATHKMYWAKELAFADNTAHTLNYNIRILGRHGVLVLNAVAAMSQLEAIHAQTPEVISAVEFNDGHRYADYLPGKDKVAKYGLTGLLLGAVAAKAGFFKLLWVGILALKKFIVVGIVALIAAIKRLFGIEKKKNPYDSPQT